MQHIVVLPSGNKPGTCRNHGAAADTCAGASPFARELEIETTVRRALDVLNPTERFVVEGYYFDGRSFPSLARMLQLPGMRIRLIHRRALSKLKEALAPFVLRMWGISLRRHSDCPICRADWRPVAEQILAARTPDVTWGQIALRLERAVGWYAPTPQILITHFKRHQDCVDATAVQPKGECE